MLSLGSLRSQIITGGRIWALPPLLLPFLLSLLLLRLDLGEVAGIDVSARNCSIATEWLELELMEILDPILRLFMHSELATVNSCTLFFSSVSQVSFTMMMAETNSFVCLQSLNGLSSPVETQSKDNFYIKGLLNLEPPFPHWQNVRIQLLSQCLDTSTNLKKTSNNLLLLLIILTILMQNFFL